MSEQHQRRLAALPPHVWREHARRHADRVDALTRAHRERNRSGRTHPVEDFLFTYYSHRPAVLRRWHPGVGVGLVGAEEHRGWKFYTDGAPAGPVTVDVEEFLTQRGSTVRFVHSLLAATAERPAALGCFGLHEWAMVYRAALSTCAPPPTTCVSSAMTRCRSRRRRAKPNTSVSKGNPPPEASSCGRG